VVRVKDVNNNIITQLPPGTTIDFNLIQYNIYDRTPSVNNGVINRTISIQKNGVELSLNTTSTDSTLNDTRPSCRNNFIYRTNTQKTANIQIQNNDFISGNIITQITKITPFGQNTGGCESVTSVDSIQLDMARIQGCTCCSANTLKTDIPSMTSTL
jgi:hypothetical protein